MKKIHFIILFALISNFQLFGFQQDSIASVSTEIFVEQLHSDSTIVVLDVRTPEELNGPLGHINGVLNIPVSELEDRVNEIELFKDSNIYVICRSGNRSKRATLILLEHNFKPINVLGGMKGYNKFIEPIESVRDSTK